MHNKFINMLKGYDPLMNNSAIIKGLEQDRSISGALAMEIGSLALSQWYEACMSLTESVSSLSLKLAWSDICSLWNRSSSSSNCFSVFSICVSILCGQPMVVHLEMIQRHPSKHNVLKSWCCQYWFDSGTDLLCLQWCLVQTTFWNTFSWKKMFEFCLKFPWRIFQLTNLQH